MEKFGIGAFIVWGLIVILGVWGYIENIIKIFANGNVDLAHITLGLVVRIAGIFLPFIGAIAGWF